MSEWETHDIKIEGYKEEGSKEMSGFKVNEKFHKCNIDPKEYFVKSDVPAIVNVAYNAMMMVLLRVTLKPTSSSLHLTL
jgi:hypothetical protein